MAVVASISEYIELDYLWYNIQVEHFFRPTRIFFTYTLIEINEIKVVYWAY